MVSRDRIIQHLNQFLQIERIHDYGPNGLQVEGQTSVSKIMVAVSASVELFTQAAHHGAQMIIVHHGIFWNKASRVVKGGAKQRLKLLLEHDMTLLAYHLPLDCHDQLGNNVLAAQALGLQKIQGFGEYRGVTIGKLGQCRAIAADKFLQRVAKFYGRDPLVFPYGPAKIRRVGIISGGAQSHLADAIDLDLDCFITGEVSEQNYHQAKEAGIHFIAAGHYATECPGIFALGDYVRDKFKVAVTRFTDQNPV